MDFKLADVDVTGLAIADFDLMWCQRYLIAYRALLKKPQGTDDPWTRIDLKEEGTDLEALDILARSLVTSIVISYNRPWSNNRGVAGKRSRLPRDIFKAAHEVGNETGSNQNLLPFNFSIHKKVVRLREKIIAHSDHIEWGMQIASNSHMIASAGRDPFHYLSEAEAQDLLENTKWLRSKICRMKNEALGRYRAAQESGGADA